MPSCADEAGQLDGDAKAACRIRRRLRHPFGLAENSISCSVPSPTIDFVGLLFRDYGRLPFIASWLIGEPQKKGQKLVGSLACEIAPDKEFSH